MQWNDIPLHYLPKDYVIKYLILPKKKMGYVRKRKYRHPNLPPLAAKMPSFQSNMQAEME